MVSIQVGNHAWNLIAILAISGEFPMSSVHLLGNERVYKRKISQLTTVQSFINLDTGEIMVTKVLTISGRGRDKTIRLHRNGLEILKWFGLYQFYKQMYCKKNFSGDRPHKERNHRIAEVFAICMRAGIGFRFDTLPLLQGQARLELFHQQTAFYNSLSLKQLQIGELNKIRFTRFVGALFANNTCYAVYNARNAVMKWNGRGELKTQVGLGEIVRMNVGANSVESAILFAKSDWIALNTILASEDKASNDFRMDKIYQNIYFLSLDENGMRMIRFFLIPNWREKLMDMLFTPTMRINDLAPFECDAFINGVYVLSYLDGNMARLIHFHSAMKLMKVKYEILCFPFQVVFLREYFGKDVPLKTIELSIVEDAMGVGRWNEKESK